MVLIYLTIAKKFVILFNYWFFKKITSQFELIKQLIQK